MNTAIFRSLIWQLKILTVIIGIVVLSLIVSNDFYILHIESEFFLGIVIITFMTTVLWIIFAFIDALSENEILSKMDFFYHVIGGALLIIGAICWFVSISKYTNWSGTQLQNIFAGIFGFVNGFLYIFIGFWLFRSSSASTQ